MRTALLAILLAACGAKPSGNEPLIEASVVVMEELARVADAAGDDCLKLATGLEDVLKRHEQHLENLRKLKAKARSDKAARAAMRTAAEAFKDRTGAAMAKLKGPMLKCKEAPAMKELEDKLRDLR